VSSNALSSPSPAAVSASATAARLSAGGRSPSGRRVKDAQAFPIFRLVASSNGLMMLDYTTSALDEMRQNCPQ